MVHRLSIQGAIKFLFHLHSTTEAIDLTRWFNAFSQRAACKHLKSSSPRPQVIHIQGKNHLLRSQSSIFPAFAFFIFPRAFSSIKERFLWRAVPFVRLIHFKCKNSNLLRLLGLVRPSHLHRERVSLSDSRWKSKTASYKGCGWFIQPSGKVGGVDGSAMQMRRTC